MSDPFEPCEGCAQPDHCRENGCFGEKARGFKIDRGGRQFFHRERKLTQDIDAYKRMRKAGYQPSKLDGSAVGERSLQ